MMDNTPTLNVEKDVLTTFDKGTPLQRLFGETLRRVGGLDFLQEWAEDNPSDFVRILLATNPAPAAQTNANNQVNVNIHPALTPGPLDITGETLD